MTEVAPQLQPINAIVWWDHFTTVQKFSLRGISTVIKKDVFAYLSSFLIAISSSV